MRNTLNLTVKHLCLMLCALFLFGCNEKRPAKITVHVKNGKNERIIVSKPVQDGYVYLNQDTIRIGDDSIWVLPIEIDKIGIATISVADQRCNLILQPGDDLDVTFDAANPKGDLLFAGTNAAGQMHFNGINRMRNLYAYEWASDYTVAPLDTVADQMWQNFQNLADRDKAVFFKLKEDNLINPAFQEFVEQDIQCYFMTQLSRLLVGNYRRHLFEDAPLYTDAAKLIDRTFQAFPISEDVPRYLYGSGCIESYLNGMSILPVSEGSLNLDDAFTPKTNYANAIRHLKQPNLLEYALAMATLDRGINNKAFDDQVVTFYADFVVRFPNSSFSPLLKPYADQVSDFREKIKQDFSSEVVFVEGYSDMKTLKELLSRFKGKNLFVDFWFSTCGPCREQFKHSKELKKFLSENNIEMLYISVDRDDRNELWENCIKYYELNGNQVRTTRELHRDIDENYGIHNYPTYMLINANGEIVVPRAFSPDKGEKLFNQMKENLDLSAK